MRPAFLDLVDMLAFDTILLNHLGGGRIFPGVHHRATFQVSGTNEGYEFDMTSADTQVRLSFAGRKCGEFPADSVFSSLAETLPDTVTKSDFEPIARLQQDLSPIFAHIYLETGVYLESLENSICSLVNTDDPILNCK